MRKKLAKWGVDNTVCSRTGFKPRHSCCGYRSMHNYLTTEPKLSRYGIQMPSNGHSHSMSPVWESEEQRTETHGDTVQSTTTPIPQTSGLSCLSQNSTIISCISVAIPSPQQPSPSVAELDDEIVESCTEPLANKTAGRHNGAVVNSSSYDIGCVYDATSAVSRSTRLDLSDWSVDNETTHSNLTTNSPSTVHVYALHIIGLFTQVHNTSISKAVISACTCVHTHLLVHYMCVSLTGCSCKA